jgi:hypothetical protein
MVRFVAALSTLLCASLAAAQLTITNPSASTWWVAQSQNVLAWTCKTSPQTEFTILITNQDKTKYPSPLAFIAIQQNFDCSIVITQDQANQPAGQGWQILFANPLNNTDVYASSDVFEIKPLGSAYPSQVTPSANPSGGGNGNGSSSATGTNSAGNSVPTNAGDALSVRSVGMGAAAAAALGLVALLA